MKATHDSTAPLKLGRITRNRTILAEWVNTVHMIYRGRGIFKGTLLARRPERMLASMAYLSLATHAQASAMVHRFNERLKEGRAEQRAFFKQHDIPCNDKNPDPYWIDPEPLGGRLPRWMVEELGSVWKRLYLPLMRIPLHAERIHHASTSAHG